MTLAKKNLGGGGFTTKGLVGAAHFIIAALRHKEI
jgi:hypothetical protein